MKRLLLLAFVLAFTSFVSAQTTIDWDALNCATLTYNGTALADAKIPIPKDLTGLLNDEIINLEVEGKGNISAIATRGMLTAIQCSERKDATLYMYMSKSAIQKMATSAYPLKTFKELNAAGDIQILPLFGLGFIKVFFLSVALVFV